MTKTQRDYYKYLKHAIDLLRPIDINIKTQQELLIRVEDTELIVPVVGGFSSGKSTLINSFLGIDVLSTNITPETALATELRYNAESYICAIKPDGSLDKYDLDQNEKIKEKASEYQYLKLYLNNEKLKNIQPLVLVDMPGFDSPLELHNQAILNYLSKGIYFIVLTSVEDGNITKSVLRELENMVEFGKDFSFCLSKSNLKPKSDVENIQQKIQEQLEDYLDFNKHVIPLYQNAGQELEAILTAINLEKLFEKIFKEDLTYAYLESETSINTIIATLKTSKEASAKAIVELQKSINHILRKKETMIEEAQSKYSEQGSDAIINAVVREITANKDSLVEMALHNSDNFSRELNDIVKNTLIYQLNHKMGEISNDIVDNYAIEIKNLGLDLSNFGLSNKWINTISESTKHLLKNTQNGLNNLVKARKNNPNTNNGTLYKIITTTLGITTTVVTPVLEMIIIFLPEIISWFSKQMQQNKKKQEMYNKMSSEIIPSIKTKLRGEIPTLVNTQVTNIIEVISKQFEEELQQKETEIELAQDDKEKNIEKIEERIQELETTKKELQNLTTALLYGE